MKATLIGGEAHGEVFEIEDHRLRIEVVKASFINRGSDMPLPDLRLRDQTEHYTMQRYVIGTEILTFFVLNGLSVGETNSLIKNTVSAHPKLYS